MKATEAVKIAVELPFEAKLPVDMGCSSEKRKATKSRLTKLGVRFVEKPKLGALRVLVELPANWKLIADKKNPLWTRLFNATGKQVAAIFKETRKGYPPEEYLILSHT